jgi:hypothetical protein
LFRGDGTVGTVLVVCTTYIKRPREPSLWSERPLSNLFGSGFFFVFFNTKEILRFS